MLEVRRATVEDVPAIAAIHAASWQTTYRGLLPDAFLDTITAASREPMWQHILGSAEHPGAVWVATRGGEVVGFCSVAPTLAGPNDVPTLTVQTIYLKPGSERQGIGRLLFGAIDRYAADDGYRRLELRVHRDNARARAFYAAQGWVTDDVRGLRWMRSSSCPITCTASSPWAATRTSPPLPPPVMWCGG